MTTVQITLPDELAADAVQAGLLSAGSIEELLWEKLRARRELRGLVLDINATVSGQICSAERMTDRLTILMRMH